MAFSAAAAGKGDADLAVMNKQTKKLQDLLDPTFGTSPLSNDPDVIMQAKLEGDRFFLV